MRFAYPPYDQGLRRGTTTGVATADAAFGLIRPTDSTKVA